MTRKKNKVQQTIPPIELKMDKFDLESFEIFLMQNKIEIYERLINIIFDAINLKLNQIDAFEFKNSKETYIFKKVNWKGFLENALPILIKEEKYESCQKIKKIQSIINKSTNKKNNRKKKEYKT